MIDFYNGHRSPSSGPVSMYLDVRPAIPQTHVKDTVSALLDIVGFEYRKRFSVTTLPIASLGSHRLYNEVREYVKNKQYPK